MSFRTANQVYCHRAYGLAIHSDLKLDELQISSHSTDDLQIIQSDLSKYTPKNVDRSVLETRAGKALLEDGSFFISNELGKMRVSEGKTIEYDFHPQSHPALCRMMIIGRCLGAILFQRKILVLHASVVATPDHTSAIAFAASSGSGKSTMTAAMLNAGWSLVSDDILPLDENNHAVPGFGYIKLSAETAQHFSYHPIQKALHRDVKDRFYQAKNYCAKPLPLKAVFLLEENDEITRKKLSKQQATIKIMRQTFQPYLIDDEIQKKTHFSQSTALARGIDVFRLERPKDFSQLAEVVSLVEHSLT